MGKTNKEIVIHTSPSGIEVISSNLVDWYFLQKDGKKLYHGKGKNLKQHAYSDLEHAIRVANELDV